MDSFINQCDRSQQDHVINWFREFFTKQKIKEPVNDNGIRLFVMLGIFNLKAEDVRCKSQTNSNRRCHNKLDSHKLCINLQRLWEIARDGELQDDNLLKRVNEVCKEFYCESQHSGEFHGKLLFAHKHTMEWQSTILLSRGLYLTQQVDQMTPVDETEDVRHSL